MQNSTLAGITLLRTGGLAAIGMAACYISMYGIFFGLISPSAGLDTLGLIEYMQHQRLLLAITYSIGYLLFGVLLAITLQALHQTLPDKHSAIAGLAERFGWIWVMLMMASGMTYLLGLDRIFHLVSIDPVQAQALYQSTWLITNALGGGIELVGGIWVLLLSIAGLKQQTFSKLLHLLGLLVGTLGVLTVLHTLTELKHAFGLLQLIWFLWLGAALLNTSFNSALGHKVAQHG